MARMTNLMGTGEGEGGEEEEEEEESLFKADTVNGGAKGKREEGEGSWLVYD